MIGFCYLALNAIGLAVSCLYLDRDRAVFRAFDWTKSACNDATVRSSGFLIG